MKKGQIVFVFGIVTLIAATTPDAGARQRPLAPVKPKSLDLGYVKGISGEATLTVKERLVLPTDAQSIQFQDGKIAENIEFYKSPRCYLHLKKNDPNNREIANGQVLKVSKIDNVYSKGSVHVTFWFDKDSQISDLACITNYDHTLSSDELRATLGKVFEVAVSKSVEKYALFNIAPVKNAPVLPEGAPVNGPNNSARLILTDS